MLCKYKDETLSRPYSGINVKATPTYRARAQPAPCIALHDAMFSADTSRVRCVSAALTKYSMPPDALNVPMPSVKGASDAPMAGPVSMMVRCSVRVECSPKTITKVKSLMNDVA